MLNTMSIFSKIVGDPNKRMLKKFNPLVEKINGFEKEIEKLSDDDLKGKTRLLTIFCRNLSRWSERRRREFLVNAITMSNCSEDLFCIRER